MKTLENLIEKKKKEGKELDPLYKSSKLHTLQALKDEMSGMMQDDLKDGNLKKVSVASNDNEGLQHGLDKAKEMLSSNPDMTGQEDSDEDKDEDSDEDGDEQMSGAHVIEDQIKHESSEGELSDDEIQQLEALLEKLKKSKGM